MIEVVWSGLWARLVRIPGTAGQRAQCSSGGSNNVSKCRYLNEHQRRANGPDVQRMGRVQLWLDGESTRGLLWLYNIAGPALWGRESSA